MRKLGAKPEANWTRTASPQYKAFVWKDKDFIEVYTLGPEGLGDQILVLDSAPDPMARLNALALAGFQVGLHNWGPTGINGGPGYGAQYAVDIDSRR
jgi:hypothetical protein